MPSQFFTESFSLNTKTEMIVEIVKMLKLLIGNKEDGSKILEFKAFIIKYMVPKLITPSTIPEGIAFI